MSLRLTIPHYYDFGVDRPEVGDELASPGAWDGLRTRTDGPFAMAATLDEWHEQARAHPELRYRAEEVAATCDQLEINSLASYGVGGAVLEQWLSRSAPHLELTVTEYAPDTVARLREFFPDATVSHHDLLRDSPVPAEVHLFHRIDTEFSNRQLRDAMRRFESSTMIVVAGQLIGLREAYQELRKRRNPQASRAGVSRNRAAFDALWKQTHQAEAVSFHDLPGWILRPRSAHRPR